MKKFFENLKVKKSPKGTSLIELLVYFALLGIVLIIATDIMIRTSEFSLEASTRNDLQEEARFITNRLAYDMHRADQIQIPGTPGQSTTYLRLLINGSYYYYYASGSKLYVITNAGGWQWIPITSNSVSVPTYLNVTNISNMGGKPTIKMTFTLRSNTVKKGGPEQKTYDVVVGAR